MAGGGSAKGNSKGVRIVVAGDRGTGKSSLIVTAAADTFPTTAPPVLPPTRLPDDIYPERVPVTIIDTSSRSHFLSFWIYVSVYIFVNTLLCSSDMYKYQFIFFIFWVESYLPLYTVWLH